MNKGIRFTDEFKQDAVAQVVERGYAVSEVAERLGVSTKSLYCRFPRGSEPGFPSRSEPPLSYVSGVRLWSMHDCPPSFSAPLRLRWL